MSEMTLANKRKLVLRRVTLLQKLVARHGRQCWYCGSPFSSFAEVELEHIVPKSRGGKDEAANYAIACVFCNGAKGAHSLSKFLAWLRKPKRPLPHIHDRAKQSEQHWSDWAEDIEQGLRKPSSAARTSDRRIAYNVRVVTEESGEGG